jgi:hypothetical protein
MEEDDDDYEQNLEHCQLVNGVGGSAVIWGTVRKAEKSQARFPLGSFGILHLFIPSRRNMTLVSIHPLTE